MKAFVDENVCIGCELCAGICPEVFSMDDGISVAITEEIASDDEIAANDAMDSCPVNAITID